MFLSLRKNSSQNLRIPKINIIFAGVNYSNMEIKFEKDYLRELFYDDVSSETEGITICNITELSNHYK